MDWNSLLTLGVIGLLFFLMMRHGGGCCGGGHSRPQDIREEPSSKDEARSEREQAGRR
ncbi:MAG: hypothetical protein HOP18_27945 [Deltaproteobacteria bacterium]|nr:hypothetical protein [Deltaproteobacteria bacterium]